VRSIEYKGFTIVATPHRLDAPVRWSLDIDISREEQGAVYARHFEAANIFPTEDEAVEHCLEFGRRVVDGKVPGVPRSALP
jgi:hypothetical protein